MNSYTKVFPTEEQRQLGSFYTPDTTSDVLCEWGIRDSSETVLEPSFGGCGFLVSSVRRLDSLGCRDSSKQVYGSDVDPQAFEHLFSSFDSVDLGLTKRFILRDFLQAESRHWPISKFSTVIGNPPYVANRRLSKQQKDIGNQICAEFGLGSIGKANLWFYFLLHSLSFIDEGGRLAFILPATALDSSFARNLPEILTTRFSSAKAVIIKERLFQHLGVKERCLVLLCEGFHGDLSKPSKLKVSHCDDVEGLKRLINEAPSSKTSVQTLNGSDRTNYAILTKKQRAAFTKLSSAIQHTHRLADYFNIRIGTVTGDKKFFVHNKSSCASYRLDYKKFFRPVVAYSSQLVGVSLTQKDIDRQVESDSACLLLDGDRSHFRSALYRSYLETYPLKKREQNRTFTKRESWYEVPSFDPPLMFMPYMAQHGPKLVLNKAQLINTNNVHRVDSKTALTPAIANLCRISILSTFSQLSAEIECKNYGSGVLKIEPRDANAIQILIPRESCQKAAKHTLDKIDLSLRNSDLTEARDLADNFIDKAIPTLRYRSLLAYLAPALERLRKARI